jgi:hypothetical protein
MEAIKHALFDEPTSVYVVLGVAQLVLVAVWFYRRTRLSRYLLPVPILLAGGVALLDAAIVTDREQIVQRVEAMRDDFVAGRLDKAGEYIDESYIGYRGGDKGEVVDAIQSEQRIRQVESISVSSMDITVSGRAATMDVTTTIRMDGGQFGGSIPLKWRLHWVKRDGVWRISGAEEPQTGFSGLGL